MRLNKIKFQNLQSNAFEWEKFIEFVTETVSSWLGKKMYKMSIYTELYTYIHIFQNVCINNNKPMQTAISEKKYKFIDPKIRHCVEVEFNKIQIQVKINILLSK